MENIMPKRKSQRGWKFSLLTLLAFLPFLTVLLGVIDAPVASAQAALQLDANMDATWKRTDLYVAQGSIARSWLWGPQAFNISIEEYDGSPAGGQVGQANKRLVAYYDKSRMEINNPGGSRSDKYFVTNGLLVKELISGKRAFGDIRTTSYLPAEIPVVGDPGVSKAPTYASLISVASMTPGQNRADSRIDQVVTTYLERDAQTVKEDLNYAKYDTKIAYYDSIFGHNVPKIFWDYMNSRGAVLEAGQRVDGAVVDWLFSTGYPITEPFWTVARVGGQEKDVLLQCFERRCFSYTPSNPDGFKVEMGNVGRHYYSWRYETPEPTCYAAPQRGFGKLWGDNPSVKARIGCPYNNGIEQGMNGTLLEFEHGTMYYMPAVTYQPILIHFEDGSWARVASIWKEGDPVFAGLTPPDGLYEPGKGFGEVWRNQTGLRLRERLGWAKTNKEVNTQVSYLDFYNGFMVWFGAKDQIAVNYRYYNRTNVYEMYKDTFES